jgi:hypothetical protein
MNPVNFKNILGQTFGRLTVVERASNDKHGDTYWFALCSCGNPRKKRIKGYALRAGLTVSCGCFQKEIAGNMKRIASGECAFNQCLHNYQWGAKKRGISFELTKEQFRELTQGSCFYCGVGPTQEIVVPSGNGSYKYNGIDRLNSNLGYAIENCVPACGVHNLMKLDMTVEQFLQACQAVVDHQSKRLGESAAH